MKTKMIMIMMALTISTISYAAAWSPYHNVTVNSFYDLGGGSMMTIGLDTDYHNCGSNRASNTRATVVGSDSFKMLNAALVSAWISNRTVSLYHDGCDGNRANVIGIRIGD